MSQRIVYPLEPIKIEEHNSHQTIVAFSAIQGFFQQRPEDLAVREAGQRVTGGESNNLLLSLLPDRYIPYDCQNLIFPVSHKPAFITMLLALP